MIATAGAGLLLIAVIGLAARYAPVSGHVPLYWVIASPYLQLTAPLALLILGAGQQWMLAALAGILIAAIVVMHAPAHIASVPPTDSTSIRVMSANLHYGQANSRAVIKLAGEYADVILLQELTPEAVQRLTQAGIEEAFRYQALDARAGAAGVGLYSRYPITDFAKIGGYELAMVSARVSVDGVSREVSLLSVHLDAPWPQPIDGGKSDIASFPTTLADLAAKAGDAAIIVAGDFNSTLDMRPFRQLLTNGYRDAAEQAGDGRNLTYPANRGFPPVIGIDHVLTRNATAVSTSTADIPDTDHRALLTTVMVPKG